MQGHADRYTYIPMVGLSVMVAFGAAEILGKWPGTKPVIVAVACVSCVVCMALAWRQASYWQNSGTLFQHAIDTTDDNWVAECNLGIYMMTMPQHRAEAADHFETALRIKPDFAEAHNDLGMCLVEVDLCGAAIPHFEAALRTWPTFPQANNN